MASIHFILDPVHPSIGLNWPEEIKKVEEVTTDFEFHVVRGRLHAEAITRAIVKAGADLIVCAGGDQTLNEIVNAFQSSRKAPPALCVHPALQRGDFKDSLELREKFLDFLHDFLNGTSKEFPTDLVEISYTGEYGQKIKRVFLNYCAFGYGSLLLSRLTRGDQTSFSRWQVAKELMSSLAFYKVLPVKVQIDDTEVKTASLLTGFINNTGFIGRGIRFSRDSNSADGKLEFTQIHKTNLYRYLLTALEIFAGKLMVASHVRRVSCNKISIEPIVSGRNIRLDFDGEGRGFLPVQIEVKEKALRIVG